MKETFIKYLKAKLQDNKLEELLSNIKDLDNLTVDELILISNTINEPYTRIINMYRGEGEYFYLKTSIENLVKNKDIKGIKRLILDGNIVLFNNTVILKNLTNQLSPNNISESLYQSMLKILLENNEVKLAQMISNKYLGYNDLSLKTENVEEYLFHSKSKCPSSYLLNNYSKIPQETRNKIEPKMVARYFEAIESLKEGKIDHSNLFLKSTVSDKGFELKLDTLYLEFNKHNRELIINKMKEIE